MKQRKWTSLLSLFFDRVKPFRASRRQVFSKAFDSDLAVIAARNEFTYGQHPSRAWAIEELARRGVAMAKH
jgi:hypothetical protein